MDLLGFIVVCALAFWLRAAIADLKRRALSAELGLADLRGQITALQRSRLDPTPPATETPAPTEPSSARKDPAPRTSPPVSVPPVAASILPTPPASPGPAAIDAGAEGVGLEERLGTRWAVWVGALALALGGLLLVRYSIEAGLIGPGLRIALGTVLAAALAYAGEHLRRRERRYELPVLAAAHIPSALTSAATVVALGTTYAAHALYGFLDSGAAFLLLGAIALSALAAAAVHGPALAGVGLLGAFAVPALVSSNVPNPWPVVVYLGVVGAAAFGLARLREWLWLAGGAVAGALLWTGFLMALDERVAQDLSTAVMAHVLVQLGLAAYFMGIEPHSDTPDADAAPDWIGLAALFIMGIVGIVVMFTDGADPARSQAFALVSILILATAGFAAAPIAGAMLMAGLVAVGLMLHWKGLKVPASEMPYYLRQFQQMAQLPERIEAFVTFATLVPAAIAAAAAWRLMRGAALPMATASLLAAAATLPPLVALVIAYLRVTQFDQSIRFAAAGVVLSALFAIGAELFQRAEARAPTPAMRLATGALAAASIAAFALAMTCGLERGYLTVAFALAALGTAFVAVRRDIPVLRYAVVALGLIVLARVAWDPLIMGSSAGATPIFNWLLFGYGVPAVSFALAARLLGTRTDDVSVRLCDGLAVLFAALLVGYEIRHLLHGGDPLHEGSSHVEMGLQTTASLGLSYVLARLDLARANPVFRWGSIVLGCIAAAVALIGLGFDQNPLFSRQAIQGAPWLSSLSIAYLLPGAMAVLAARAARGVRPDWYVNMVAVVAVALLMAFVTLEVRHVFQGPVIHWWRRTGGAEQWAYSIAWLTLGLAFLAYGVVFWSKPARLASAGLVVLSVLKVFLLDLQGLTGLWRALSFISLGVVLIGIGLVYQRLLFQHGPALRRRDGAPPDAPSPPPT